MKSNNLFPRETFFERDGRHSSITIFGVLNGRSIFRRSRKAKSSSPRSKRSGRDTARSGSRPFMSRGTTPPPPAINHRSGNGTASRRCRVLHIRGRVGCARRRVADETNRLSSAERNRAARERDPRRLGNARSEIIVIACEDRSRCGAAPVFHSSRTTTIADSTQLHSSPFNTRRAGILPYAAVLDGNAKVISRVAPGFTGEHLRISQLGEISRSPISAGSPLISSSALRIPNFRRRGGPSLRPPN
jgi:hypothetical protein